MHNAVCDSRNIKRPRSCIGGSDSSYQGNMAEQQAGERKQVKTQSDVAKPAFLAHRWAGLVLHV